MSLPSQPPRYSGSIYPQVIRCSNCDHTVELDSTTSSTDNHLGAEGSPLSSPIILSSPSRGRSSSRESIPDLRSRSPSLATPKGERDVPDMFPPPSRTPSSNGSRSPTTCTNDFSSPFSSSRPNSSYIQPPLAAYDRHDFLADTMKSPALTPRVSSPLNVQPPEYDQDPRFWFHDGNLFLQINSDSKTFKLHRSILEMHSSFFKGWLEEQIPPEELLTIDDSAVSTEDFRELLSVVYPQDFTLRDQITASQWGAVLRAATHLHFNTIRELAIQQLTAKACPVDKIVLGHNLEVPKWLEGAYQAICDRQEPLTEEEGKKLGVEVVIRIMRARESTRTDSKEGISMQTLRTIFGLPKPITTLPALVTQPVSPRDATQTPQQTSLVALPAAPTVPSISEPTPTSNDLFSFSGSQGWGFGPATENTGLAASFGNNGSLFASPPAQPTPISPQRNPISSFGGLGALKAKKKKK